MPTLRTELDPAVEARFAEARREGTPTSHQLAIASARQQIEDDLARVGAVEDPAPIGGGVRELVIQGPTEDVRLRIYAPAGDGPHPVVVWFHGGGWVRGSLDSADPICRELCNQADCSVVSVDYRLAPEHPFPAGLEDCYAALEWTVEHPEVALADPDRVAIGGASAGGNLAAAVALLARDRDGPAIDFQVPCVPVMGTHLDTDSYHENATGYGLHREDMRCYWDHYLARDVDRAHPYAAPLRARRFDGLPPAIVTTAGFDPLRDEGLAYAEGLEGAGIAVERNHFPDMPHNVASGVYLYEGVEPTREAFDNIGAALRDRFGT